MKDVRPSESGGLPRASHCVWCQKGSFFLFHGPEEVYIWGGDRTKRPCRAAGPLRSPSASHAGKAGGKRDAEHLKTCARQTGSVVSPVNLLRWFLICKFIYF